MVGRRRKPDEVKRMQGTLQKCREIPATIVEANSLSPLSGTTPPKWLPKRAKSIFKEKANQLMSIKVLTAADIDMLAIYANSYNLIVEATEQIQEKGTVTTISKIDKDGNSITVAVVVNPSVKVYQDNVKLVNQIGSQFGFSPSSRASIMAMAQTANKKQDDFDEF